MIKYAKSLYWAGITVYSLGVIIFPYLYFKSGKILHLILMSFFLIMLVKEYKDYRKIYK